MARRWCGVVLVAVMCTGVALGVAPGTSAATIARGADATATGTAPGTLEGTVVVAGTPVRGAQIVLSVGTARDAVELGRATTSRAGEFSISYEMPEEGVLTVAARGGVPTADPNPATSPVRLLAVVGIAGTAGATPPRVVSDVTVNELTTVASTYALAQFLHGSRIFGSSPGLDNAAATAMSIVDPVSGTPGAVLTNRDNVPTLGAGDGALVTINTLANLVAACAGSRLLASCTLLRRLATPPGGSTPRDTVQAVQNLVKNPLLSRVRLFRLAQRSTTYEPTLPRPPEAWLLALHYIAPGMWAPGRVALDAKGNVWTNNNWERGTTDPSPFVVVLDPAGTPILGSPLTGGGIRGSGWGAAIAPDGSAWFSNFGGNSVSAFAPDGTPISPASGWTNGGFDSPQGLAIDQRGNVWVANSTASSSGSDPGSVVVYPGGDPAQAVAITAGGIDHPFSVQIDGDGNAWVANAGTKGGSVTVITPEFEPTKFSPIEDPALQSPKGLALDSEGNAWVSSFDQSAIVLIRRDGTVDPRGPFPLPGNLGPWGIAVDGADRVWVGGFSVESVFLLCGVDRSACPPGSKTGDILSPAVFGFHNQSFQHITAVQIDPSGNVWAANNWSALTPPAGGDGLMELVGLAPPVCTPLVGLPVQPSTGSGQVCAA